MQIRMQNAEGLKSDQISDFLKASAGIDFAGQTRVEIYGWIQQVLVAQDYGRQSKKQRGRIRAYLSKVTGRSLAQVTRLIRRYLRTGMVRTRDYRRRRFASQYTANDLARLAEVDRWHERRSGPATLCILKREYHEFGKAEFQTAGGD